MKIAGLDIGTTGCKLTVFEENGQMLEKAYRDYPVRRAVSGHEMDASAIMDGVIGVIRELAPRHPDLAAIGVTSFGETFVLANESGLPLCPSMLYTDPRGAEECAGLCEKLGPRHIASVTGLRPHQMYSLPKMMWIRNHHPEIWKQVRHVFLIEDYVVYHLSGHAQMSHSLATRTMAFDIRSLTWSRELFDAAGIDISLMSPLVPSGTPAGTVTAKIAAETGLSPSCQIVTVCHDQVAACVGAGAFDGSVAVDGAGTVECLTPVYDALPDTDAMYDGFFSVVPYVLPGKYVAYAFTYTGGALIQWCMETFGKGETYDSMEGLYTANRPTDLLVLPHFAGAATPYMDIGSKGAIVGLTASVTAPEIYRACMEGVAYEMRLNYEALQPSGVRFRRLNATGGGARSKVWMQMKADMLNLPITALKTSDAGTVGSAMLTGIAVGCFANPEEAARVMVREAETYVPRPEWHEAYMKNYERYKKLYGAVRPLV